jgi:peptide/nickel transport system substrate-binding protein
MPAQFLMFLPLVRSDSTGRVEPWLAESWEHSPDYRTWTVRLRSDVRWHDGVPFTAYDVEFTYQLLSHPEVLGISPNSFELTVHDESTFTITYQTGESYSSPDTFQVYYPKHLLEDLDPKTIYKWEFWTQPVGNGPYCYVRHVPYSFIEFEANEDYFLGKPSIETVVLRFGQDEAVELLSGSLDLVPYSQLDSAVITGDSRSVTYHQTTGDHFKGIAWNQRHPALRDPLVRRALTLAINRRELHRVIDLPDDTPVFDVIFTRRQFQNRRLPEPLAFDPDRAKALLDEAGWHDFDGDVVRENGKAVLELSTIVAATQGLDKAAVYVQSQLKQLGVRLVIQNLELGRAKERATSGDFDALFMIFQHVKRDVGHKAYFGSQSPIGYSNPDVIALLEAAESTVDPDEMDRIYQQLMPIFQEDLPATFLYPMAFKTIAHRRVRGLEGTGWGDPLWNMDRLWLEEE